MKIANLFTVDCSDEMEQGNVVGRFEDYSRISDQ